MGWYVHFVPVCTEQTTCYRCVTSQCEANSLWKPVSLSSRNHYCITPRLLSSRFDKVCRAVDKRPKFILYNTNRLFWSIFNLTRCTTSCSQTVNTGSSGYRFGRNHWRMIMLCGGDLVTEQQRELIIIKV